MDFTLDKYKELLLALRNAGYRFVTLEQLAAEGSQAKTCCLRHDVDKLPRNSLRTAELEQSLGIRATYYFRIGPESNQPSVIRQIVALGHEIGYHYEDMSLTDGRVEQAYEMFRTNLAYFRTFYPVKTICMHGAPTSRYDGRDLWKQYDYHTLGLTCEPYLDLDYSRLFYLTDTGRRWDGYKVSVRDKIPVYQDQWNAEGLTFHATDDIIRAVQASTLARPLLITTHPQRWTNSLRPWVKELVMQNLKNIVKSMLIKI